MMNEIFTKAYDYLAQLLAETVKALKSENKIIVSSVDKVAPEIKSSINKQTSDLAKAIYTVTDAVNNKEVAKEVRVANPESISGEIVTGLTDVVKTLKDEIKKFDREIVVKNDLSALASAFKSNQEKKDFIAALKQIENKIKQPELTDYTQLLSDITDAVDKVGSKIEPVKLKEVETILNDIRSLLNQPIEYIPAELIHYDRLKVELPDEQVKSMSKSAAVLSQSGGIQGDLVNTNVHTGNKEVRVYQENHICTGNTTSTPLLANATFTGEWQDCLNYQEVNVSIVASHNSATNGLVFQWSADGVNIGDTDVFSYYAASGGTNYTPNPAFRYVRMVYTNGATNQTSFSLQTILRRSVTGGSFHRIDSTLKDDADARLQITVPKLKTAANTYVSQTATTAGNAKVSLEEYPSSMLTNPLPVQTQEMDSPFIDAFGRKRVSETGNRFDIEFLYNKQPSLIDELIVGAATSTHNSTSRDITLAIVNTNNTTSASLYSHYDIPYTPGSGQLIDITGTLNLAEIAGGSTYLFLRTKVTGSVQETTYLQSAWNKNIASSVDWSKSQILMMDFQSLKIGRIRFNLVRNGIPVPIHEIYNDNLRAGGYWQTPTLPIYWRIYNDADYTYMEMGYGDTDNAIGIRHRVAKNALATMRAICATVKSEGGESLFNLAGLTRAVDTAQTAKTVSTTLVPVLSIRPAATFNSITNRILGLIKEVDIQTDNPIRFVVLYRPTLTNASFSAVDATNSGMEFDTAATAVTGGMVVFSSYLSAGIRTTTAETHSMLGRAIVSLGRTGTSDIITIAAIRTGASNASVLASIAWDEIR